MSTLLLSETRSVLSDLVSLRRDIDKYCSGLARYSDCTLRESFHKGESHRYFYLKKKGEPGRKYLGPESNETVCKVRERKYYDSLLKIIDTDIQLLRTIDEGFVIPNHQTVLSKLPNVYQQTMPLSMQQISSKAAEWKRLKEQEKARYAPFRPEDLKHRALDGTMMRSLSEVNIANYLISLGITFVYELPLTRHGKTIIPDFTILSPIDNKTMIIIEHQGAIGNEAYDDKFMRTLRFYLQTELVPNKDVFFTFNHMNGNLDLRQIDNILHMAFRVSSDPS